MGLFDAMYKKPIPKFAARIGICTAKTGAAVRDIINIASRRNPYVQLYLYSSLVQGEGAAKDIVNGIRCLDSMNLDVIIVGRGGGSIEDLWAFNEEIVAKAIFDCNTPVISAVGHETDTTIADFVADMRAPTPSAAAEIAVFDYKAFVSQLDIYKNTLNVSIKHMTEQYKSKIRQYETSLQLYSPMNQLRTKKQYTADIFTKLNDIFYGILDDRRHKLAIYAEKLNGLSPLEKISKGFAYVSNEKGKPVQSVEQINIGENLTLVVHDGTIDAEIKEIKHIGNIKKI